MSVRTFISVEIPEEVREEIIKIQNALPEFVGKKTEPENLHLTLKFLGHVDELALEKIKKKLESIKIRKFEAGIDKIGVFSPKFIKIIWLHLASCELLQKEVDNALEGLFEKETRFMSHLTIARVKKMQNKKEFLEKLSKIKIKNLKFDVDKFYLIKSELNEKGPVYFIMGEYPLI